MDTDATEELRKVQVEYSYQKNKSVRATLAVYTFLNITAIGLIFYIARSR
jgi:hypothetical protein